MLAGMKMGRNLKTGLERYLKSWKSADVPSIGDFTYRIEVRWLSKMKRWVKLRLGHLGLKKFEIS